MKLRWMNGEKAIVFDLDGTLAASKSSLDAEMSSLLHDLLGVVKVAVISGGAWLQFEKQVLSHLPQDERLASYPFSLPVEHNFSNTPAGGRSSMRKISLRTKKRRSSVP
jgi:hydroxymethylpyrimidine pyrophosphatase-like HAD family hydrolase